MTDQQTYAGPSPDLTPIPVHVTGVSDGAQQSMAPKRAKHRYHLIPRTVVLTADEPVKQLLRPDPNRCYVSVIAFTNQVVLTESKGDGQAAANIAATPAAPTGGLIPAGSHIKLGPVTDELWAAGGTYPTMITVLATYER